VIERLEPLIFIWKWLEFFIHYFFVWGRYNVKLKAILKIATLICLACSTLAWSQTDASANTNRVIRMSRATWDTGWFQAEVYKQLFERLGYAVEGPRTLDNPEFYTAVAERDVDLWVNGWFPLHTPFVEDEAARDKLEVVGSQVEGGALQGYLMDKGTAQSLGVTQLADLVRPDVAERFDLDGNGKADLIGCNEGWSCAALIEEHLANLDLSGTVEQVQGDYSPMMLETFARFKAGEPVLFYTFTPNWTIGSLVPGEDVIWLELPESDVAAVEDVPGCPSNPCAMGFAPNDIRAVANKAFLNGNPAIKSLLQSVKIPLEAINAQNALLVSGEGDSAAIQRHAEEWLTQNEAVVSAWLSEAAALDPTLELGAAESSDANANPTTEGAPLRVATMALEPFVQYQNRAYLGFSVELWDLIAEEMDVPYELYGVNSVAKLLDEVERGAADLAVAGIGITAQREENLNFSHPYFESGLQILVSDTGSSVIGDSLAVLRSVVFAPQLLRIIGVLLVVLLIAAHIIWLAERRHNPEFPRGYRQGIWEAFWWSAVTATTVGYGDKTPKGVIGRLFGLIWMFAGLFVLAYFTAGITTIFTVQELRGSLNGPQDLPGKRVATIERSAAAEYLERQGLASLLYENREEAYEALDDGEVDAVVYDAPVLQHYVATAGKGRVKLAGLVFQEQNYGIALPQNSPYREPINVALLELIESGEYRTLYDKWFGVSTN